MKNEIKTPDEKNLMPFYYITNERQAKEGVGFSHEKKDSS